MKDWNWMSPIKSDLINLIWNHLNVVDISQDWFDFCMVFLISRIFTSDSNRLQLTNSYSQRMLLLILKSCCHCMLLCMLLHIRCNTQTPWAVRMAICVSKNQKNIKEKCTINNNNRWYLTWKRWNHWRVSKLPIKILYEALKPGKNKVLTRAVVNKHFNNNGMNRLHFTWVLS